jgi:hypothetical protein
MLVRDAWHCPLFFCADRWYSRTIRRDVWAKQAAIAVSMLQDDGGIRIENYDQLPWWRPVWTLEMMIRLKKEGLLEPYRAQV